MEDEGIMALPQGQRAMQNQDLPAITSMDSYDAATTALGRVNPEQLTAYKQAIREAIAGLNLSPAEIETLLEIVEYMSQNPAEYPKLLRQLIDQDYIDEGDLPEQFDPVYLGVMLAALNELKLSMAEGVAAPMQMAPEVEGLGPLPMAEGGLADMARLLAAQGRNGDTMLAHITPEEARLLKSRGGSGSINPQTGLPEFFLGKLFKGIKKVFKAVGNAVKSALKNPIVRVIASVALATVLGPTGFAVMSAPAAAATASAATTLGAGGSLKEALISSATSYFGAGGGIGSFKPGEFVATKVGQYVPGGATGAIAKGIGSGVTGTGIGLLAGMKPEEALRMGAIQGLTTGATEAFQNWRAGQPKVSQPVNRAIGELPPENYVAPTAEAGGYGTVYPDQYSPTEGAAAPTAGTPTAPATATTAPAATQVAGTGGAPTVGTAAQTAPGRTFTERLGQFVSRPGFGTFKDAFLVNPNETQNYLARYAPAALTTVGIGALTGGFKQQPVDQNPLFDRNYRGLDFMRDNPQLFGGSLGRVEGVPQAYNPVVTTPSYATLPVTTPPVVVPRGITLQPRGVPQPYNVAGLYGVPELSAPVQQPVYMANGGDVAAQANASLKRQDFRENPYVQGFNFTDPNQIAGLNAQQERFSSILSFMNMNPGMSFNKALAYMGGDLGPTYDKSANFDWGGDLPYDPTIYAGREFDWQQYLAANPDLRAAGIDTPWEAATHYSNYGKNENRAGVEFRNKFYGDPEGLARFEEEQRAQEEERLARMGGIPPAFAAPAVVASVPAAPTQTMPSTPARSVTASFQPAFFNSMSFNPAASIEAISSLGSPDVPKQTVPSFLTTPAMFGGIRRREDVAQPYNVAGLYMPTQEQPQMFNKGGQPTHFPRKTGPINGPGTGTSDSIPAMLSDGEFVFTAKAVRNAGGGSRRKGAKRMYALMKKLEGGPVKGNA